MSFAAILPIRGRPPANCGALENIQNGGGLSFPATFDWFTGAPGTAALIIAAGPAKAARRVGDALASAARYFWFRRNEAV
jgi:hypothetical protein